MLLLLFWELEQFKLWVFYSDAFTAATKPATVTSWDIYNTLPKLCKVGDTADPNFSDSVLLWLTAGCSEQENLWSRTVKFLPQYLFFYH